MKFQTTLSLSDVSLRRPFFQLLISLLSFSRLDRDFFYAGYVPQANRQTFKVSVTTVKSMQHKRTGEKETCVSHMKIYGCCEEKLKGCCALEWGQIVLQAARAGDAFCWILLFCQGKIGLNFSNLSVSGTTSLCVCSGVCWAPLMDGCPPSVLLLLPSGTGLTFTELLSVT